MMMIVQHVRSIPIRMHHHRYRSKLGEFFIICILDVRIVFPRLVYV